MRAFLTAVLLGIGTLCATTPADASWLSEMVRNSNASIYIGPGQPGYGYAQPYGYVQPTYYPQPYVAPYAPAPYIVPSYVAPVGPSFYQTRPAYPLYPRYSGHNHHHHHHHH